MVGGEHDQKTQSGHIGWEGSTGYAVVLGAKAAPNQAIMQMSGIGWRLPVEEFMACVGKS